MNADNVIKSIKFAINNASQLSGEQIENIVLGADIWLADNCMELDLQQGLYIERIIDSLRGLIEEVAA